MIYLKEKKLEFERLGRDFSTANVTVRPISANVTDDQLERLPGASVPLTECVWRIGYINNDSDWGPSLASFYYTKRAVEIGFQVDGKSQVITCGYTEESFRQWVHLLRDLNLPEGREATPLQTLFAAVFCYLGTCLSWIIFHFIILPIKEESSDLLLFINAVSMIILILLPFLMILFACWLCDNYIVVRWLTFKKMTALVLFLILFWLSHLIVSMM